MTQSEVLRKIIQELKIIQQQYDGAETLPTLAVFDLDSTLFDVSPRIRQILQDFAVHPEFSTRFPESTKVLKNLQTERNDWGIKDAIIRAGLHEHSENFLEDIKLFWKTHFFSNPYLHYDEPYPGATEFVQTLWQMGVEIVYLTGRDQERMGTGSFDVLKKWGFPVGQERAQLVLKPKAGLDDAKFKREWFDQVAWDKIQKSWFFENEPVNLIEIEKHHPHVDLIFIDSTHSRKAPKPLHLPQITHFLLHEN